MASSTSIVARSSILQFKHQQYADFVPMGFWTEKIETSILRAAMAVTGLIRKTMTRSKGVSRALTPDTKLRSTGTKTEAISPLNIESLLCSCRLVLQSYPPASGNQHKAIFDQDKDTCTQVATWEYDNRIATCFGTFEDVAIDGNPTYNILLESTHDNLWDYWIANPPPRTFRGIQNFYTNLFDLATGLDKLQEVRERQNVGLNCVLRGDIRPEGICVYTPPSQTDPGLSSTFKLDTQYQSCTLIRLDSKTGRRVFVVLVWFGSNSKLDLICGIANDEMDYDYRQTQGCISRPDDSSMLEKIRRAELLSFSCVLSLAATWMTKGKAGLETLERAPLPSMQGFRSLHSSSADTPSGCAVATPNVHAWHDGLYRHIQPEDKITAQLLHLLDEQLFQPRTAHRMRASELKKRFRKILEDAALEWHLQNRSDTEMDISDNETDARAESFFQPGTVRRTQSFAAEMSEVDPGLWGIQPGLDGGQSGKQQWAAA
ncbi:hypothetical protein E8E11_001539 [Didymella keratinophila]|nr:hypothetical protein E8E11_001539 [Didymella keratinophila]